MGTQASLVNAWCGAFIFGSKLGLNGGGHSDYGGNEIPAIDLGVDSPVWDLLVERTPVASLIGGSNYYADGLPTSRHTYYGMWVATVDGAQKMLRFNSNMGFAYFDPSIAPGSADVRTVDIDAFNLVTNEWEPGAYGPMLALVGSETSMCQDPETGDCYTFTGGNDVYRWRAADNDVSLLANLSGTEGAGGATVFDAVNQRLVRFAGRASSKCIYWDAVSGLKVTPTLTGPDASDITSLSGDNHGWGIAHDSLRNVAYLLKGDASILWRIRLSDFYVERVTTTGETFTSPTNGTWGRLKYVAPTDSLAYLASWSTPVIAMRCG